jgi:hypothetical protein
LDLHPASQKHPCENKLVILIILSHQFSSHCSVFSGELFSFAFAVRHGFYIGGIARFLAR